MQRAEPWLGYSLQKQNALRQIMIYLDPRVQTEVLKHSAFLTIIHQTSRFTYIYIFEAIL